MPIILIITFIIVALGLGGYFWESSRNATIETPTPVATEITPTTPTETPATTPTATPETPVTTPVETADTSTYKDGTYTADVSYRAPDQLTHPVHVSLTIKDDIVTASDISFGSDSVGITANRQQSFAAVYATEVVGKPLASISLSRVGGSSLTTNAWNEAKAKIEADAKS